MGFLLNPLGFLDPITTSLPLIAFRAYWPLSQPNEFTNSFPELPWPIYSLFTSYCSHGFTTSFIGFLGPFTSSLPLIILIGFLAIVPAIPACWVCFTIFSSQFLHICWVSSTIRPFVKSGYQHLYILSTTWMVWMSPNWALQNSKLSSTKNKQEILDSFLQRK